MNTSLPLSLSLAFACTLAFNVSCKTTSASKLKYANESTSIELVKTKLCKDFKKEGDCILRLQGYKADEAVQAALLAETPMALKKLKEYGINFENKKAAEIQQKFTLAKSSGLTDGELYALALYTADDYVPMNAALRGDAEKWKSYSTMIYGTASALTKLRAYTNTDTVYRTELTDVGKIASLQNTYKVGNIVIEAPFLSSSTDSELEFVSPKVGKVQLKYAINSKFGVDVKFFSSETSEGEVTFAPGSVFKVTSVVSKKVDIADEDDDDAKPIMVDVMEIGLDEVDPSK